MCCSLLNILHFQKMTIVCKHICITILFISLLCASTIYSYLIPFIFLLQKRKSIAKELKNRCWIFTWGMLYELNTTSLCSTTLNYSIKPHHRAQMFYHLILLSPITLEMPTKRFLQLFFSLFNFKHLLYQLPWQILFLNTFLMKEILSQTQANLWNTTSSWKKYCHRLKKYCHRLKQIRFCRSTYMTRWRYFLWHLQIVRFKDTLKETQLPYQKMSKCTVDWILLIKAL